MSSPIVRAQRHWLRAFHCLLLSGATLVESPEAFAQVAPAEPARSESAADAPDAAPASPSEGAAAPAAATPGPGNVLDRAPGVAPPEEDTPSAAEPGDAKGKKKKHRKGAEGERDDSPVGGLVRTKAGQIQLKGRVFARAELQRQPQRVNEGNAIVSRQNSSLDLSVQSVRVGIDYESPIPWLTAVAELELTGKPSLKDGFVQARDRHWQVRAGQFKMPTSVIESESPWTLPTAGRGMMHDFLVDWLDVGGRQPGVIVAFRSGAPWHLKLTAGAFQGSVVVDATRETDPIKNHSLRSQSYVGRAQVDLGPVAVGAWYEHRVGSPAINVYEHYPTAGMDATIDHRLPNGGIRAWVEGIAGESWLELAPLLTDGESALFAMGRALVAWRLGGTAPEAPYVEPFGQVALIDPDRDTRKDLCWEAALGVNAGFWGRARLTLQGEVSRAQSNFPSGYRHGTGYLLQRDPDHIGLIVQAGVAW